MYSIYKNRQNEEPPVEIESQIPNVNITRVEENITIDIAHNVSLTKVLYYWNDEEEKEIITNNAMNVSETITLPFGSNILHIKVVDKNGNESEFQKEYIVEGDGTPVVELLITSDNKIRIKAQDNAKLQYVQYCWNNENYQKININLEDPTYIEYTIDIPLGQNTLKVEAVNSNNISTIKELEVKGVKRPLVTLKQEGDNLIIRAEDENLMKVINYILNGQKYQINVGEVKVITHTQSLQKGENYIELSAENVDGGITQVKGRCFVN